MEKQIKIENGNRLQNELDEKINRYARVSHYVLITGERGTGKTTIAKEIHCLSNRNKKEFVNLNCASLSAELLESELFGYEKGAFTGANAAKIGLFEIASGGTLFLDEIGELTPALQAKLLKAVEEKKIRRIGSTAEKSVDVRIIAATSQNLKQMVADNEFRADLYDRLNILNLETIPLRRQKERIEQLLIEKLREEQTVIGRQTPFEIGAQTLAVLHDYEWTGNYRELLNYATRLAIECMDDAEVTAEKARTVLRERINLSADGGTEKNAPKITAGKPKNARRDDSLSGTVIIKINPAEVDLNDVYIQAAGSVIEHLLERNNGKLRKTAVALGATHSTVASILKKYKNTNEQKNNRLLAA